MAIDTTPSQVATNALQAIPFGSIIGGPLKACIEAQAMAADIMAVYSRSRIEHRPKDWTERSSERFFPVYAERSHGSVECSAVDDCTNSVHRHS